MYRRLYFLLISLTVLGCSSSATVSETPPASRMASSESMARAVFVPPGVDSSVAVRVDSVADNSFVSKEDEQRAAELTEEGQRFVSLSDTLWKFLEVGADTAKSASREDSIAAIEPYNRGAEAYVEFVQITRASELDSTKLVTMQDSLLSRAQTFFERSVRINPYDDETRYRLSQVYQLRAQRLGRRQDYQEAIGILERLTRLRKNQPGLFNALANSYYSVEQWRKAAENYAKAREVYIESVELSFDTTAQSIDSSRVYSYALAEANAYRNAQDAQDALGSYRRAGSYATTETQVQTVDSWIEWINWDDGNIAASMARDSLARLAGQSAYEEAVAGFRTLKDQLNTQGARDEIDWRLAQSEYQAGKRSRGAERLQALYERTDKRPDGTPADSTYQRYFDDYAAICFNLGQRKRSESRRTALKYFEQSASVQWTERGLSALEAAKILRNNADQSIKYLEIAEEQGENLSIEDRKQLYQLLTSQHRKLGDRQQARKYYSLYQDLSRRTTGAREENE